MKKLVLQFIFDNGSNIQARIVIGMRDVNKIRVKHEASVFEKGGF